MFQVILVDDQDSFRNAIRNILESCPEFHIVAEGRDGTEAVELLGNGTAPDLLLMDVQMPTMDGFEATRRILQRRDAKIALMSMNDDPSYLQAAHNAGAIAFFHKRDIKARDILLLLSGSEVM